MSLVTIRFANAAPNFYVETEEDPVNAVEGVAQSIEDGVAIVGNFQRETDPTTGDRITRAVVIGGSQVLAITSEETGW